MRRTKSNKLRSQVRSFTKVLAVVAPKEVPKNQVPVKQSGFVLGGDSEEEFDDDEEVNDDFYNH